MEGQNESVAPENRNKSLGALQANAEAVRAIASAVEGTLGPKGLDTMLVNDDGEVIVTNDGVTILSRMEIQHPAARMVANIARAQQEEVGDGTTTATLLAASLVDEGVKQVNRGVPVAKVIAGIRRGVRFALERMQEKAHPIWDLEDEWLQRIAYTAGREQEDITELVMEATHMVGREKLLEKHFKLSEAVVAHPRVSNSIFAGLLLQQNRANLHVPSLKESVHVMAVSGDLHPGPDTDDSDFRQVLQNMIQLDVGLLAVEGETADIALDELTNADIMVVQNLGTRDLFRLAEHTGAKLINRAGLFKSEQDLSSVLGYCEEVEDEVDHGFIRLLEGIGKAYATIHVGASTEEVVGERERITKDAAAAVQAAIRGGFLPGGGAAELALARDVEKYRDTVQGMEAFGVAAVAESLHRPMSQVVANAGFNPLEKVEEVKALQWKRQSASLGVDCDRGAIYDMVDMGVVDPLPVKYHALQAACEVSTAILRIHTVVKMDSTSGGKFEVKL
ncbi:TCP-1/cpn60 chaperonin family protein [Paludifilum halophilum]|uniref:Chaperonin n=1 Tax=Paludifilum halophilum TaxID=1642702 RepID=A0A235B5T5_9BACL|nr:TCP-1/cpn60 chaperonin family protein [Paludifilum halophilum]OYD07650.1 chaperonin [Paludifilum halophilum]